MKNTKDKIKKVKAQSKSNSKPVKSDTEPTTEQSSTELEIKRAKHDRVKALEGAVAKAEVSQFVLNELVGKMAGEVKKRGRNKNQIKFKKVRATFDSYN
jgi:hypothetical protein